MQLFQLTEVGKFLSIKLWVREVIIIILFCNLKEPAIGPYPEPDESIRHFHTMFKFCFSIILLGLLNDIFPSSFLTKILYSFLVSTMCATHPPYFILFYVIILIMCGEEFEI
jgi:hypothetical protein